MVQTKQEGHCMPFVSLSSFVFSRLLFPPLRSLGLLWCEHVLLVHALLKSVPERQLSNGTAAVFVSIKQTAACLVGGMPYPVSLPLSLARTLTLGSSTKDVNLRQNGLMRKQNRLALGCMRIS